MQLDLHVTATAATDWAHDLAIAGVGVVGAVLGALATGIASRLADRARRRQEQLEQDKLAAFSVRYGLLHIYARAMEYSRLFAGAHEAAQKMTDADHVSLMVPRFANMPSKVEFAARDLFALQRIGGPALYNTVASLDLQFNSFVDTLDAFNDRRTELTNLLTGTPEAEGRVAGSLSMADYRKHEYRFISLDDHLAQMEHTVSGLYGNVFEALKQLIAAAAKHFKGEIAVRVNRLEGEAITLTGSPDGTSHQT